MSQRESLSRLSLLSKDYSSSIGAADYGAVQSTTADDFVDIPPSNRPPLPPAVDRFTFSITPQLARTLGDVSDGYPGGRRQEHQQQHHACLSRVLLTFPTTRQERAYQEFKSKRTVRRLGWISIVFGLLLLGFHSPYFLYECVTKAYSYLPWWKALTKNTWYLGDAAADDHQPNCTHQTFFSDPSTRICSVDVFFIAAGTFKIVYGSVLLYTSYGSKYHSGLGMDMKVTFDPPPRGAEDKEGDSRSRRWWLLPLYWIHEGGLIFGMLIWIATWGYDFIVQV